MIEYVRILRVFVIIMSLPGIVSLMLYFALEKQNIGTIGIVNDEVTSANECSINQYFIDRVNFKDNDCKLTKASCKFIELLDREALDIVR